MKGRSRWRYSLSSSSSGLRGQKKNHGKRIKRGKRIFHVQSDAFAAYEAKVLWQLRQKWRAAAIDRTVRVYATFYRDALVGDLIGYMQGLADILQKGRVLVDDKLIVSWDGTRMMKDARHPRVFVEISTESA